MATVREAVKAVMSHFKEFAEFLPAYDIRLEETVFHEKEAGWNITVSFNPTPIMEERIYKKFLVADRGGEAHVISMTDANVSYR